MQGSFLLFEHFLNTILQAIRNISCKFAIKNLPYES